MHNPRISELINAKDFAELMDVTKPAVFKAVKREGIRTISVFGLTLFYRKDVNKFLRNRGE